MNEQTGDKYSFCPVCGTLMENGICPECAKKREMQGVYSSGNYPQMPSGENQSYSQNTYNQNAYGQQNAYNQNVYGNGSQQQYQQYGQQSGYYGQQNQQSSYYGQQPQQSGYYGQQNPNSGYGPYNPYMKPKKDTNVWVVVGIVVAVLVVVAMIVGSFFYGYALMKFASEEGMELYGEEYDFDDYDDYEDWRDDEVYGYEPDEDYVPSPDDEYYYGPCEFINKDVDYSFITKTYTNEDPENDIDVVVNYPELKGENIPNLSQLNEAIEKAALYYAMDFPKESYYAEFGESYAAYITAYVTYNDDEIISIVMDEYVVTDDDYYVDLYPLNIDVKNGVVLDNGSLLQIDEDFAKEFRKRNDKQNGEVEYLDSLSDEELAEKLSDKDYVIAYYTPLGMEIGLNYREDYASGWVTVTYKDYEKYLAKF